MLPTAEQILEAAPSLIGATTESFDVTAVRAALKLAGDLARLRSRRLALVTDECAALMVAFATHPTAFPQHWRLMARALVASHARSYGYALHASAAESEALLVRIVAMETDVVVSVRRWFVRHLRPLPS